MPGGTRHSHTDSDPLFQGAHDGGNGSNALQSIGAMFFSLGVVEGLAIENVTTGETGNVTSCTDDRVYTSTGESGSGFPLTFDFELTGDEEITWNTGDTYKIYKTSTKDSDLSYEWTDVSRGWAEYPKNLHGGWREEDLDLDDHGTIEIFGPGQPGR